MLQLGNGVFNQSHQTRSSISPLYPQSLFLTPRFYFFGIACDKYSPLYHFVGAVRCSFDYLVQNEEVSNTTSMFSTFQQLKLFLMLTCGFVLPNLG